MKISNGKPIDLSKTLTSYISGWVAIDKENKVVVHAKDFAAICAKIKNRKDLFLVPAAKNYFGFITVGYKLCL